MKRSIVSKIILLFVILLVAALPFLGVLSQYTQRIAIMCFIYIILATSLNLISGVAGQVSMGHAGFFAIGAYTSAILSVDFQMPALVGLLCGGLLSGLFALAVGWPCLKLSGGYLAIFTLGFAEVIRLICINWRSLTRGNYGLRGISRPSFGGYVLDTNLKYYLYAFVIMLICLFFLHNLGKSWFGRNLAAIKDDEIPAEAMGINVHLSKTIAFAISAFFAGVAGSVYAHFMTYIDPSAFVSDVSTTVLGMVVLGGFGSFYGCIASASVLTALPEMLRGFSEYRMLLYGFVLVIAMLLRTVDVKNSALGIRLQGVYRTVSGSVRNFFTGKASPKKGKGV